MAARTPTLTAISLAAALTLGGCAFFDRDARDRAACDEISNILSAAGESSIPTDASAGLITALERQALPLASARFGGDLRNLIDSYKSTTSGSIFDTFAGFGDTLYFSGLVLERCYQLSSRVN